MFSFRNIRYFGLDMGESAIKLVEIKKARDGFRLGMARLVELNIDPLFDDSEKRNSVIAESLRRLLAKEGINQGVVALSISGQSVFIRPFKIPKIAKSKIEQIIQYEAQLQVPFPINEVIWDYELFETYDSPEAEVTLVAVKRDIVEEKLKLVSGTNLEVDFVEVNPFSLFNALDFVDNIKNRIVIDFGAKITDIIIAEERKIWTRSILVGGNDLTKAISSSLKINFMEAEELKIKEGVIAITEEDKTSTPYAGAISDAITPVMIELLRDISRSIGYYKSQFDETQLLREILITGGGSKLRNIAQFITSNIDTPTKVLNLFEKIKGDIDFEVTPDMVGRMDVGVGLALRTVTPLATKTNLLPKEILRAKGFEKRKWYVYGSLAVAILIFMTMTGFINWTNKKQNTSLVKASSLINRYTNLHAEIAKLQEEINSRKARLDFIASMSKGRARAINTILELVKLLPDNLWLTGISQDKDIFTLTGRARGTFESISQFKDVLMGSGYFKNVEVESADVLKAEDAALDVRAFTIKIEMYPLLNLN